MHLSHDPSSKATVRSRADATSLILKRFGSFLEQLPEDLLVDAANKSNSSIRELLTDLEKKQSKKLSVRARNQLAFAENMNAGFQTICDHYELLDANIVSRMLGISRQALSKKGKVGQVLAYTHNRRKYFPDFQFERNAVLPGIAQLLRRLGINPEDESDINLLIAFLAQPMDFSDPGQASNRVARYRLISDERALEIIIRDYENRLSMGQ